MSSSKLEVKEFFLEFFETEKKKKFVQTSIEKNVPTIEPNKYIFCRRIIQTESSTSISIPILLLAHPIIPCFAAVINSKILDIFLGLVLLVKQSWGVNYNNLLINICKKLITNLDYPQSHQMTLKKLLMLLSVQLNLFHHYPSNFESNDPKHSKFEVLIFLLVPALCL